MLGLGLAGLIGLVGCSGSDDDDAVGATSIVADAGAETTAASGTTNPPATAGPTATFTVAPEDEALCAAAQRIDAGDAELQEQLQAAVAESVKSGEIDPFAVLLGELRSGGTLNGIAEAYDDLEAAAPADQQANVRVLADFTTSTFDDLEAINTVAELEEWATNITSDPDAIAAQEGASAISAYVQDTCGISLTS